MSEMRTPSHAKVRHFGVAATTVVLDVLVLLILAPRIAYAYIDPGYVSLFLQGLASAFFGFLYFGRDTIARLWARLVKRSDAEGSKNGRGEDS